MMFDLPTLLRHAWGSVRNPSEEARWLKGIEMPRAARWDALLLIVVISVILSQLTVFLSGEDADSIAGQFMRNPMMAGLFQLFLLVAMVLGVFWIGRAMGGAGGFDDTILVVAWIQFIMACIHVIQMAAMIVLPPLAEIIAIIGSMLFFWLLTNFVAELHGFKSLGLVFLMIIVAAFGIAFGTYLLLALIGVDLLGAVG